MDDNKAKALAAALAQIEKQFGKGSIMKMGEGSVVSDIQVVSTGSLGLDIAGPGIGWSTRMTDPLGIAILAGLISFIFLYCKDQAEPRTME